MFRAKITSEPAGVAVGRDAQTADKATVTVHRLWDRMPTTVGTEESAPRRHRSFGARPAKHALVSVCRVPISRRSEATDPRRVIASCSAVESVFRPTSAPRER
jgi:hypothetical protein